MTEQAGIKGLTFERIGGIVVIDFGYERHHLTIHMDADELQGIAEAALRVTTQDDRDNLSDDNLAENLEALTMIYDPKDENP